MNNLCQNHRKLLAVAYCGECDTMLCVECFTSHRHISMNIKQYNDIYQILSESSLSVYITALLNVALSTLKEQIEAKIGNYNTIHTNNDKRAIEMIQALKLEAHQLYLDNIKNRIKFIIDSRISEHIAKSVTKIVDTICNSNYGKLPLEGYVNDSEENKQSPKKGSVGKSPSINSIIDDISKAKIGKEISNGVNRFVT